MEIRRTSISIPIAPYDLYTSYYIQNVRPIKSESVQRIRTTLSPLLKTDRPTNQHQPATADSLLRQRKWYNFPLSFPEKAILNEENCRDETKCFENRRNLSKRRFWVILAGWTRIWVNGEVKTAGNDCHYLKAFQCCVSIPLRFRNK